MKKNKAFTLVEIMIVIVIIGLLAAMAIPAFQKVRIESIYKAAYEGQTLDYNSEMYLRENWDRLSESQKLKLNRETLKRTNYGEAVVEDSGRNHNNAIKAQTIVIDGKTYYIIPAK